MRPILAAIIVSVAVTAASVATLGAHSSLRLADPLEGATLGDSPTIIRLTFSERPEASLSEIRVLDASGVAYQDGRPSTDANDPFALSIPVRKLTVGVYTVNWRIVSAVDGHATTGAYAFGVRVAPTTGSRSTSDPVASRLDMLARWLFLGGLMCALGGALAPIAGYGGRASLALASVGCWIALTGALLLGLEQRIGSSAPMAALLKSTVGRAIAWRIVASGVAGTFALAAALTKDRARSWLAAAAVFATLAAMAIHAAAGHAAASGQMRTLGLIGQWMHFAAAGVWIGGLAALLLEVRSGPTADTAIAVRRFSRLAVVCVVLILSTGLLRGFVELTSWRDLIATSYGFAVVAKSVLFSAIVMLGAINRRRSVPVAATSVRPLRRIGSGELGLAAITIAAAAILGALPPPAAALAEPVGLSAEGTDFATTVNVRLIATSDQPGPNRFIVRAVDYDTHQPVTARRVRIRFVPTDDPTVEPTTLDLAATEPGTYVGSGVHLAFAGRWQAIVAIERESGVVEVPLEVEARTPDQWLSVRRTPGIPVQYTVSLGEIGDVRFSPDPERAGPSTVTISFFGFVHTPMPVGAVVVTLTDPSGHTVQLPVRHLDATRVVVDVNFQPGSNRIAATTHIEGGTRMRAVVDINVPIRPLSN